MGREPLLPFFLRADTDEAFGGNEGEDMPSSQLNPVVPHIVTALGLASLLATGCGEADGDCTAGGEGCACVEMECLGALVCGLDNVCVSVGDTDGAETGGASGAVPSDDDDESGPGFTASASGGEGCDDNSAPSIDESVVEGTAVAANDENVRVTITVSDPDGLDDIEDAVIVLPDGNLLKTMGRTSQDTFSAEIDWSSDVDDYVFGDIPLDSVIEFQISVADGCGVTRTPLPLTVCEGSGDSFCGDACIDVDFNEDACGSCDNACANGQYCDYGTCAEDYAAVPSQHDDALMQRPIAQPSGDVPLAFGRRAPGESPVDVTAFDL